MHHIFNSAHWIAQRQHQIHTIKPSAVDQYHWIFGHWCTHNLMDPHGLDYTTFKDNYHLVDKPVMYALHPLMNPSDDEYTYTLYDLNIKHLDLAYYPLWQGLTPQQSLDVLITFDWSQSHPQQVTHGSWYHYVWQHNLQSLMSWQAFAKWCAGKITAALLKNHQ